MSERSGDSVDQCRQRNTIPGNFSLQLKALIEVETDMTANLANVCAALKEAFGWWWVGFYLVKGEQLVLGPFQGPVACMRVLHSERCVQYNVEREKIYTRSGCGAICRAYSLQCFGGGNSYTLDK